MPKSYHNDIMDKGLEQVSNSANWGGGVMYMAVCVGAPASVAEANTLYPTGKRISTEIAMAGGDFTLADRGAGGREVTVAAKTDAAQVNIPALDSGIAEAGSATTLTDTDKAWGANIYAGKIVKITAGTGVGQLKRIASNTGSILTVESAWATNPDATSEYVILEDLHAAIYDGSGTPRLLVVDDVSSDQEIVNGNPLNISTFKFGFADPV